MPKFPFTGREVAKEMSFLFSSGMQIDRVIEEIGAVYVERAREVRDDEDADPCQMIRDLTNDVHTKMKEYDCLFPDSSAFERCSGIMASLAFYYSVRSVEKHFRNFYECLEELKENGKI